MMSVDRFAKYIVLLLSLFLVVLSFSLVKGYPIIKDARDNSTAAYHLWQSGEVQNERKELTYGREPLPIWLTAWHVKLFTSIPSSTTLDEFNNAPEVTTQILKINSVLSSLSIISTLILCRLLGLSWVSTGWVVGGSWFFFILNTEYRCNLYTEILAALIVLLIAICSVLQFHKSNYVKAILIGFLMGLFSLTKAAGLYIAVVTILFYTIGYHFQQNRWTDTIKYQMLTLLGLVICVSPWMYRNYVHFGEFAIAQRGGIVLLTRAVKNHMNHEEYKGAYYVYAPDSLKPWMERMFGYKPEDLAIDGQYTRLIRRRGNDWDAEIKGEPERAVSFFSKAHAFQQKVKILSFKEGVSIAESDRKIRAYALNLIKKSPVKHLKTTPLFAWRGIWSFNGEHWFINLLSFMALLTVPIIAIFRKNAILIALSGFSVMTFAFYASLTHFISRYSAPLIPIALICLVYCIEYAFRYKKAASK